MSSTRRATSFPSVRPGPRLPTPTWTMPTDSLLLRRANPLCRGHSPRSSPSSLRTIGRSSTATWTVMNRLASMASRTASSRSASRTTWNARRGLCSFDSKLCAGRPSNDRTERRRLHLAHRLVVALGGLLRGSEWIRHRRVMAVLSPSSSTSLAERPTAGNGCHAHVV
jgi:hypothetical protein